MGDQWDQRQVVDACLESHPPSAAPAESRFPWAAVVGAARFSGSRPGWAAAQISGGVLYIIRCYPIWSSQTLDHLEKNWLTQFLSWGFPHFGNPPIYTNLKHQSTCHLSFLLSTHVEKLWRTSVGLGNVWEFDMAKRPQKCARLSRRPLSSTQHKNITFGWQRNTSWQGFKHIFW